MVFTPAERQKTFALANPWYMSWRAAKERCTSPKHKSYRWYGARGILFDLTPEQVRVMWERDGAAAMRKPTIDRIDPDGNYTAANCRFQERAVNLAARRSPGTVTARLPRSFHGETLIPRLSTSVDKSVITASQLPIK